MRVGGTMSLNAGTWIWPSGEDEIAYMVAMHVVRCGRDLSAVLREGYVAKPKPEGLGFHWQKPPST